MTCEQERNWVLEPLNGTLTQVPGIGDETQQKQRWDAGDSGDLARHFTDGITTVWQLFGAFLLLRKTGMTGAEHRQKFYTFMEEMDVPSNWLNTVVQAIESKMAAGIVDLPIKTSEALRTSSRMTEDDMHILHRQTRDCAYAEKPFNVFKGLKEGGSGMRSLQDEGIETTWQVLGKLLSTMDSPDSNTPDSFLQWLGIVGVASAWKKTVAFAATELVSMGLFLDTGSSSFWSPLPNKKDRGGFVSPLQPIPEPEPEPVEKKIQPQLAQETKSSSVSVGVYFLATVAVVVAILAMNFASN
jgi:hypothetical protein